MFIAGTPIFTDSGWKNIEDISGRDKVLVRNFIGHAEFLQPFAVKKRQYDGEVVTIGAKDWSFTVTPEHPVTYDLDREKKGGDFRTVPASEMRTGQFFRIHRKFKYMFSEEPPKEMIKIRDDFGERSVTISDHDWYKLVAYVLCRGFIRKKPGKPMLMFFLDEEKIEEETRVLGDILDRIGVGWHVQYSEKTRPKLVCSSRNTLANRLRTRLGSSKRKEMYLPDKMVYHSSKELTNLLMQTIIELSVGKSKRTQFVTTNKALIDSLTILGTLGGYSITHHLSGRAGTETVRGLIKRDSYIVFVFSPTDTYSPRFIKKSLYSGYVYGIDLFEGQVYAKEGLMPVWINPK